MKLFLLFIVLTPLWLSGQSRSYDSTRMDIMPRHNRCGMSTLVIPALVIMEGMVAGMSYYAAKPKTYGDKVMGGMFALSSAYMLYETGVYLLDSRLEQNWSYKGERAINTVMMLGMSYGFARVARYNLFQAKEDGTGKRFRRNFAEMNASWMVPLTLFRIANNLLEKRAMKRKSKTSAGLFYDGNGLGLAVRF